VRSKEWLRAGEVRAVVYFYRVFRRIEEMTPDSMIHSTLDDWIRSEAIPFSLYSSEILNKAIDRAVAPFAARTALATSAGSASSGIPRSIMSAPALS
jgi:hypothetical protein